MMKSAIFAFAVCGFAWAFTTPALALDLNSYRAQHGRPPLAVSSQLMGLASSHAADMARRKSLDHKGSRARLGAIASAASLAAGPKDQLTADGNTTTLAPMGVRS